MSTRTILPGRQNRDSSEPPTAPGTSCERIRAAAPAMNHRPLKKPSDLPRSTSRRSRRQCPSSGVKMIRRPYPRQLIRIFILHSRRIYSSSAINASHMPQQTPWKAVPASGATMGLMTDSIEIARLNAEAVRVVTNITSDVANLEEGGTAPPSRPHGFQSVTRSTAGVDSQGGKDAKRRRHESEKMIGNTDRWIACSIDVPRSRHEESR